MSGTVRVSPLRVLLTWLAVWPSVTVLIAVLQWIAPGLPMLLQTMILSGLLVPTSAFVIAPCVNLLLRQRNPNETL